MLGSLNFTGLEHQVPFNFSYNTALIWYFVYMVITLPPMKDNYYRKTWNPKVTVHYILILTLVEMAPF